MTVSQVGNKPAVEAASTWGGPAAAAAAGGGGAAGTGGPVSRGYKEEMADFAYCVRQWKNDVGYKSEKDKDTGKEHYIQRCQGATAKSPWPTRSWR